MNSMVKDLLTDDSNVTFDILRVLAVCSVVIGLGLEVFAVGWGRTFDIQAYGIGLGTMLGVVGGVLKLNQAPAGVTATSTTTVTEVKP